MKSSSRKTLWVIFFIVLLDLLGFGIVIPILPILFTDPQASLSLLGTDVPIGHRYILYGLLLATYPIFQFFSTPVLGQLSDRYGRKHLLFISMAGTAFSYVLFGIGLVLKDIPLLFVSRAIDGLTGGNIAVAQAVVADIATHEKKAKYFGIVGAGFGIGLVFGPYIGGKLSDSSAVSWFSTDTPFWFAAVLSFVNMISIGLFLNETLPPERRRKYINWLQSLNNITAAFKLPKFHRLFLTGFFYQAGFAFFTAFISVFLYKNFHFNQGTIGEYFAYAGLCIALTQVIISKPFHSRFEDETIIKYSLIGCFIMAGIFLVLRNTFELYLITAVFAICNGLVQTTLLSMVSKTADELDQGQGKILGINSSVYSVAQATPPLISGVIAASVRPETPILTAAIMILIAAIAFSLLRHKSHPIGHKSSV